MADVMVPNLLKQRAVYWTPLGQDPQTGVMQFDEAIEVKCRWVDDNQLFINANGEEAVSKCLVMVDRDMEIGGVLWLGNLVDLEDQDEPMENEGANIIQGWKKVPDVAAKKFVRTAIC
jgi:hypothetical protein